MERIRCPGCMKEKQQRPVCEHCGYNENVPNYSHQLPVGTILQGRYTVGKALGQGGFGITYIGWDGSLQAPIAIKEYYPNSFVSRECAFSLGVHCAGEGAEEQFRLNRERFLREARILAKLSSVPGIVRVQNLFEENNTAYIVMEYVEGIDLKHYIRMRNRVLTWEKTLSVMRPILYALHKVHEAELVHRDISPDNIMILPDGTAKLLDFGAAREVADAEVDKELPQSTEAILKHGFAPMEQYRRRGSLGPWTDVYALCATMYYCMTGKVPNSAPERMLGDDNINWNQVPGLSRQQIQVLEKGMALVPENRVRTVKELYYGLFHNGATEFTQVKQIKENKPEEPAETELPVRPRKRKVSTGIRVAVTSIAYFLLFRWSVVPLLIKGLLFYANHYFRIGAYKVSFDSSSLYLPLMEMIDAKKGKDYACVLSNGLRIPGCDTVAGSTILLLMGCAMLLLPLVFALRNKTVNKALGATLVYSLAGIWCAVPMLIRGLLFYVDHYFRIGDYKVSFDPSGSCDFLMKIVYGNFTRANACMLLNGKVLNAGETLAASTALLLLASAILVVPPLLVFRKRKIAKE